MILSGRFKPFSVIIILTIITIVSVALIVSEERIKHILNDQLFKVERVEQPKQIIKRETVLNQNSVKRSNRKPGKARLIDREIRMPKSIYMTARDRKDVDYDILVSWRTHNPFYKIKIYNDVEIDNIVRINMPKDIYEAFKSLPMPVLKADYFRYIALYLYGGTYTDTDTLCVTPIDTWNNRAPGVNMIVSIEAYNADINFKCEKPNDYARGVQFIQWTFSSVKRHPILWNVINRIKNVTPKMIVKRNRNDCDVLDWTGPGIWSDAILDYLNITDVTKFNIQRPRLYKDVYILPTEGFKGSRYYHPETKVQHLFSGSWKNKIDKIN